MAVLSSITRDVKAMYFYWLLTDYCNFKCSYCPPNLHQGLKSKSPEFPGDDEIINFIGSLEKFTDSYLIIITLSGGKPTVHPSIELIINQIKKINGFVELVTNGSRPISWWNKLTSLPDSITISLHPEFTDLEKINNLGLFLKSRTLLSFNLMADPENWDWIDRVYNNLDSDLHQFINVKILTVYDGQDKTIDGKLYSYTQDQIDKMQGLVSKISENDRRGNSWLNYQDGTKQRLNPLSLTRENKHQFLGWYCRAGQEGFKIDAMGNIYAGLCSVKKISTLRDFVPNQNPIICPKQYCKCPADIKLEKWKPISTMILSTNKLTQY
jgi:organic radical activating enzyme